MMRRIGMTMVLLLCGIFAVLAQQPLHVVILGDSNTFIGGDQCDKPQGWNKWFKEMLLPMSCRSYARSGATWTETPQTERDTDGYWDILNDNNVISNQIWRLIRDVNETRIQVMPDLILIMAGTNDLWFADKRPEPLPDAIQKDCELLTRNFPEARIILITPPPFTKVSMDVQHHAAEVIEQCAQSMGLSVIRLDRAKPLLPPSKLVRRGYSKDGVHTTPKGAKVLGKYIYNQVQAILLQ